MPILKMSEFLQIPDQGGREDIKGGCSPSHDTMTSTPERSYDRTWEEIEAMLDRATEKMHQWKEWYDACKDQDDKEGMKEAARNHKALEGVVKTLKWTLGEKGITDPLN